MDYFTYALALETARREAEQDCLAAWVEDQEDEEPQDSDLDEF